jgi:hypothetical protein
MLGQLPQSLVIMWSKRWILKPCLRLGYTYLNFSCHNSYNLNTHTRYFSSVYIYMHTERQIFR